MIEARDKFARNRRLLLRETLRAPDDPLPWYYLGMDQVAANRPAEAAEYLRRSLACSDNRPNWSRVDVYTHLIVSYIRLNDLERLEPIVEEAERAGALSASARTSLALSFSRARAVSSTPRGSCSRRSNRANPSTRSCKAWRRRLESPEWSSRTLYERMGKAQPRCAGRAGTRRSRAAPARRLASTAVRLAIEVGDMASLARSLDAVPAPR